MAETTCDPRFCTLGTLAGAPAIAIPNGRGPAGLPIGLQLVGRRGDDARLLATASWVEATLVDEQER
jgi:Asp-tRNA(Asn)/Glu-tRNA(Gln) amidotransferase A subunit family amidase